MKITRYTHQAYAWELPDGAVLPHRLLPIDPCSRPDDPRAVWECPITQVTQLDTSTHEHKYEPWDYEGGYVIYMCKCGEAYRHNVPIRKQRTT